MILLQMKRVYNSIKRPKLRSSDNEASRASASASASSHPGPENFLTLGDVNEFWLQNQEAKRRGMEFARRLLFESKLKVKKYPKPEILLGVKMPLMQHEQELKAKQDEAVDRLYLGVKNFKQKIDRNKNFRALVSKGGAREHEIFFSLIDEYPELVKDEDSQGLSQG